MARIGAILRGLCVLFVLKRYLWRLENGVLEAPDCSLYLCSPMLCGSELHWFGFNPVLVGVVLYIKLALRGKAHVHTASQDP